MPRTLLLPLLACALLGPAAPLRADLPEAPPTSIHGYVTTDYQGGVLVNDASGKNKIVPNFEQVRFVFGFLSQLGADWAFNSEVEFEHATRTGVKTSATNVDIDGNSTTAATASVLTSASAGLEVELEQAWIENRRWDFFKPRFGIVLPPIGRFNINHDMDSVASVDRPLSTQVIMPVTWYEPGLGFTGLVELGPLALGYEAYAINGLRASASAAGDEAKLRDLRMAKDSANDNNTDKAAVGRVSLGFSALELGFSGYRGSYDPSSSLYFTYGAVDGIVKWRALELQGEWVSLHTEKAAGLSGPFAGLRQGWYAQLQGSFVVEALGTFQPYAQFSQVDPNTAEVTSGDQARATLGLNYRPTEKVVFKLGYSDTQYAKGFTAFGPSNSNENAVLDQRLHAAAAWGF